MLTYTKSINKVYKKWEKSYNLFTISIGKLYGACKNIKLLLYIWFTKIAIKQNEKE